MVKVASAYKKPDDLGRVNLLTGRRFNGLSLYEYAEKFDRSKSSTALLRIQTLLDAGINLALASSNSVESSDTAIYNNAQNIYALRNFLASQLGGRTLPIEYHGKRLYLKAVRYQDINYVAMEDLKNVSVEDSNALAILVSPYPTFEYAVALAVAEGLVSNSYTYSVCTVPQYDEDNDSMFQGAFVNRSSYKLETPITNYYKQDYWDQGFVIEDVTLLDLVTKDLDRG